MKAPAAIALQPIPVAPNSMPAVDKDVLIWTEAGAAAELGAWMLDYWVDAHGSPMAPPVAWAEMPVLPVGG